MPKIGVVLALDGEREFSQAMSNATKNANLMKTELSRVKQQFSENANSMEALRAKQTALTNQLQAYTDKLDKAKAGQKNAVEAYNTQKEAVEKLKQKLTAAQSALDEMEAAGEKNTKEYDEQKKAVEEYTTGLQKEELDLGKAEGRVLSWQQKISKSKEEIDKTNKALGENEKYLNEAEKATDKCATSIDKYGKSTESATEVTTSLKEKIANAFVTKGIDLAVQALGKLKDAAIDAAKYTVEVGSTFEAAMSKVEGLSGASGSQLSELEAKAKELGSSTKFSASEVAEGFSYMSLAGWDTASMLNGIDGVLNLAAASEMDLASASDMVTDYLSAFGMEASESAKMADMLAYAQANSNTSAEQLGEAYGNCAANLHTAGQDIETVTSLLEAMANQGTKGSEAGTALSAIMTQITQKMQDGAIAIGDTSVSVQDSQGNFRDLTDILTDVEAATNGMGSAERSAALAATFNRTALSGLNQIFTEGMDKVSGYEDALRGADGAASDMADTMQDNLQGKMTALNSALEGLGIAAYNYISGPLSAIVEKVTGVISEITEELTPQRTELEKFIDDISDANTAISESVENVNNTMSNASENAAVLSMYKDTLLEVNSAEEKSEYQKYQVKNIVEELAGDIPELAAAYNEETGAINLSNQEIEKLLASREKMLMQQASMEAQEEAYKTLFDAELNAAKATSAVETAEEDYTAAMADAKEKVKDGTYAIGDLNSITQDQRSTLEEAKKAQEDANKTVEDAGKAYTDTVAALEEVGEGLSAYEEGTQTSANATTEATEQISDAYNAMNEAVASAVESAGNIFDEYKQEELNPDDILKNMEDQAQAFEEWQENLKTLASKAGKEMDEALYEQLADMGPEGANYVEAFAKMSDEELKKASESFEKRTSAIADTTEENMEDAADSVEESVSDMQDAAENTGNCYEAIRDAFSDASDTVQKAGAEIAESTKNSFDEAVSNAEKAGVEIPEGLADGIRSGTTSPEQAIEQINSAIAEKANSLVSTAEKMGIKIPDSIRSGIAAGGSSAVAAVENLNQLIAKKQEETKKTSEKTGQESSKSQGSGISKGKSAVTSASGNVASAGATSAKSKQSQYNSAGRNAAYGYAAGIRAGTNSAVNAASSMAASAIAAANKKNDSHSPSRVYEKMGGFVTDGYAMGILNGTRDAVKAAEGMATASLKAAQEKLEIQSPSKAFRKKVGRQVGKGFAFGIKDTSSLAGSEAAKMSAKVYSKATEWLTKYKKKHKVSLSDEKYYWKQIASHAKTGTDAYNKAIAKMVKASVSKTTTSGSGKNKKTVKKDTATYYSEILSAAETYAKNQQILNDWSLERQLSYWTAVKAQLKKGTQAWYDATATIKDLKEDIAEAAEEAAEAAKEKLKTQLSVQEDILSKYKVYNKMSAKAEMQYWDIARKQFKEGTDERIEADQKYLEAKEDYYEELTELDEEYAENKAEIEEELADKIKEYEDEYEDAVKERKKTILSSMSLFESWDAGGYTKDVLTANLKTQVEGLKFWEEQLEELGKKNISQDLLDELAEMGPDAAASLWSLNQMTAEELDEYNKLWTEKNELAQKQALEDNEALLKETQDSIASARKVAQDELTKLKTDYDAAIADLNTGLSEGLQNLVTQAAKIGEDIVSSLVNAINSATTTAAAKSAANTIINAQSSSSSSSSSSSKSSSSSSSSSTKTDAILAAIKSGTKRSKTLTKKDKSSHAALWEYIVSKYGYAPTNAIYKKIAKQLGVSVSSTVTSTQKNTILKKLKAAGYAKGKKRFEEDGEYWLHEGELLVRKSDNALLKTMNTGEGVIPAKLTENLMEWGKETPSEFLAGIALKRYPDTAADYLNSVSGIGKLNRLTEQTPQATVVKVDNGDIAGMMQQVLSGMQGMINAMSQMQMVTDTGALVGELQPLLSRENAAVTIRKNRGRL